MQRNVKHNFREGKEGGGKPRPYGLVSLPSALGEQIGLDAEGSLAGGGAEVGA